ncbi:hypothetical protein NUW54_g10042 [Trametes sanguinea]|uniref:Uncharacterized protein n=1 Tax=Trametes sanguinea TaxID=158606 RepID=A0ACC1P337_9APHY|nr:hypothetical protein NUW54_g10042 [Trametes sanguinea]
MVAERGVRELALDPRRHGRRFLLVALPRELIETASELSGTRRVEPTAGVVALGVMVRPMEGRSPVGCVSPVGDSTSTVPFSGLTGGEAGAERERSWREEVWAGVLEVSREGSMMLSLLRIDPLDDDIIEISSDSDDGKPAAGGSQSDDDVEWWQRPPFNNQPSLYSQRRASSSRGSLIPSLQPQDLDVEGEEGEDLWAEVEAEFAQRSERAKSGGPWSESAAAGSGRKESGASSSRTPLTGKRTYRNEPFPSSSQESMLDEDGAGFHKEPSVVIDLT